MPSVLLERGDNYIYLGCEHFVSVRGTLGASLICTSKEKRKVLTL